MSSSSIIRITISKTLEENRIKSPKDSNYPIYSKLHSNLVEQCWYNQRIIIAR